MIANQTGNKINWRELKAEYLDPFGNAMFEKIHKISMGDVIDDFYKSDSQFKGKSKEKRRQMAIVPNHQ